MTKAVAYLVQLTSSRKLSIFAREHKLSYVYLWQLKTPRTDSRGRPLRDRETGRVLYLRTPSFKIINRLKAAIPTEYWYEEVTEPLEDQFSFPSSRKTPPTPDSSMGIWILPDDPFCGVVSAYECDPELADRSRRFPSPLPKIILDFSF